MLYRCWPVLLVGCATAGNGEPLQQTPDAPVSVDAAPMPDAPPCMATAMTQLLVNPAFDATPDGMGWTQTPINGAFPIVTGDDGLAEQTPARKAWMGGYAQANANDQLYQDVTIPANTKTLVMKGFWAVGTTEPGTAAIKDTATVQLATPSGTVIDGVLALDNKMPTTTWQPIDRTVPNAAALSGTTVRVLFKSANDAAAHTNFFFDSLTLTATHCP